MLSAARYITAGISTGSLSRIASWSTKLRGFLEDEAFKRGHSKIPPRMLADNDIALDFLAAIADEDKGRTRVS